MEVFSINLYINRGTYVPVSVCRGKAARGEAALRARSEAARARRSRVEAAYNLVTMNSPSGITLQCDMSLYTMTCQ